MRVVLIEVGEDLRVSEIWRHSRCTVPIFPASHFHFDLLQWPGRVWPSARENCRELSGVCGPNRPCNRPSGRRGRSGRPLYARDGLKDGDKLAEALLLIGHGKDLSSCTKYINAQSVVNSHFLPAGEHRGEEILIKGDSHSFILQLGRSRRHFGDQGAKLLVCGLGGAQHEIVTCRVTGGFVEQSHDFVGLMLHHANLDRCPFEFIPEADAPEPGTMARGHAGADRE